MTYYRPMPPSQGITLTPTDIFQWKKIVIQCKESMLNIAMQSTQREQGVTSLHQGTHAQQVHGDIGFSFHEDQK